MLPKKWSVLALGIAAVYLISLIIQHAMRMLQTHDTGGISCELLPYLSHPAKHEWKTGDIILWSRENWQENFIYRPLSNCDMPHSSFVVVDERSGEVGVISLKWTPDSYTASSVKKTIKHMFPCVPLRVYLSKDGKHSVDRMVIIPINIHISNRMVYRALESLILEYRAPFLTTVAQIFWFNKHLYREKEWVCSNFILQILASAGVLSVYRSCRDAFRPCALYEKFLKGQTNPPYFYNAPFALDLENISWPRDVPFKRSSVCEYFEKKNK